jgi:hypothetical protein
MVFVGPREVPTNLPDPVRVTKVVRVGSPLAGSLLKPECPITRIVNLSGEEARPMDIRKVALALIPALGVALACGVSMAEPINKVYRVGIMVNGAASSPLGARAIDGFRQNFGHLGYVDGESIVIEPKFAEGRLDRLPVLADELVQLDVDVILALGASASRAAKNATSKIPVIFSIVTDPIAVGLVTSTPIAMAIQCFASLDSRWFGLVRNDLAHDGCRHAGQETSRLGHGLPSLQGTDT